MRVLSREQFEKCPDGTVYYLYSDLGLRGLGVKVGPMELEPKHQAWRHIDIDSPKIEDRLRFKDTAWTKQYSVGQMFAVLEPCEIQSLLEVLGGGYGKEKS